MVTRVYQVGGYIENAFTQGFVAAGLDINSKLISLKLMCAGYNIS